MIRSSDNSFDDLIANQKNLDMLRNIAAGILAEGGKAFFQSLVNYLSKTVGTYYAYVGELSKSNLNHVKTLAFYANGKIESNIEYDLKNKPCEDVIRNRRCFYLSDVQSKFPKDRLLREMEVESYIGMPLYDSNKHPLGLLVLMDRKPMKNEQHLMTLIEIFAVRASSEMERKKSEEALRHSQKKYSNLFHFFSDAIVIHDVQGKILDVNQKALDQFQFEKPEIQLKNIIDIQPAEHAETFYNLYQDMHEGFYIYPEIQFRKKNGEVFLAEVLSSMFETGNLRLVQTVIRDITEPKMIEQELLNHREQLEELVKKRTDELVKSNETLNTEIQIRKKAEKKLLDHQKQLQSLASQIALIEEREKRRIASELHDCLGQTLALAKIKLGLLNKSVTSEHMKSSIKEIHHLIEQMIKEARTLTFELSPPILYELGFDQAIKWLIDEFLKKYDLKVNLIDDGSEKPFNTHISFFLFQAVRELMINIIKHSKSDQAEIALSRRSGKLRITVSDNGIGFSEEIDKFSGYGLFNIRERMNQISGKFTIESASGKGTRVTIVAPFHLDKIPHNQKKELMQNESKNFISG